MSFTSNPVDCNGLRCFGSEVWKETIRRWVELDFSHDNWAEAKEGVCNSRVRQLGEQIYRQTGSTAALITVCEDVRIRLETTDSRLADCFMSDINCAWNGIGDWQS
jgi:hypothetical protein